MQVKAFEDDQKYKEGKFIIEKAYLTKQGATQSSPRRRSEPDSDSDDTPAAGLAALRRAAAAAGNSTAGSREINLSNILPALRGQLLRQALGLGRLAQNRDSSDENP